MASIDNGGLHFKATLDNEEMNAALEETLKRIQGLSDGTVAGSKAMETALDDAAKTIEAALEQIDQACKEHETAIASLEAEYADLGSKAQEAIDAGIPTDNAIQERMQAVQGEIAVRKELLDEIHTTSSELNKEAEKIKSHTEAVETNERAHKSLRARIKELKEEMALLIEDGIDEQSEAYKALSNELGRLQDIQGDIAAQGNVLANDEAKYQGMIQGLSGLSGAFSAATGAVSLFAGENENLQLVLTKVQSVMAITQGLQSVAQTLNKDSAFQLVTLNSLKEWWTGIVTKATLAETAETAALNANTASLQGNATATTANAGAQAAQTTAATAGTAANLTLAGAFRAVGLAIKSIPGIGWLVAGITAAVGAITLLASKANEAKKAQEELTKAMVEGAYKPIGKIEELSARYTALGNNIKDKEQFIRDNAKAFDELGVSVAGVRDAENLLINNKDAFVSAQIAKAKALAYTSISAEKMKKYLELKEEHDSLQDHVTVAVGGGIHGGGHSIVTQENNVKKAKKKEMDELMTSIKDGYKGAMAAEEEAVKALKNAGIKSNAEYAKGTIGAQRAHLQERIQAIDTQYSQLSATDKKGQARLLREREALQKQLDALDGKKDRPDTSGQKKDPFIERLEQRRAKYEEYAKWQNSTSERVSSGMSNEFAELVKDGNTYKEYLEGLHDKLSQGAQSNRTKEQLRAIRNELAELQDVSVLDAFNSQLQEELSGAQSVLQQLDIIANKRAQLKDDPTELGKSKAKSLDQAEQGALKTAKEQTDKLLQEHASYLERKIQMEREYSDKLALLERARANASTDEERQRAEIAIKSLQAQHAKNSHKTGDSEYDDMLEQYRSFEQKKEAIDEEFKRKIRIREQMLAGFQRELSEAKTEEEKQAIQKRITNNEKMADRLKKAYKDSLSKLAIDEIKISPDWEKLFANFRDMGTKELEHLLAMIEDKTAVLGIELSPEDFKVIQDKVKELKNEIKERNPFKALTEGFKDLKAATNEQDQMAAMAGMFDSAGKAGNQLKSIISDISNALDALGVEGTEEIGHAMQALEGLAGGAQDAIMGIMSGNPVQVVGGAIKAIGSVVNYFAGANDRRAEKAIKKHQENIKNLTSTYRELEWQISKALSSNMYKHQQSAIENMKQQQRELEGMIRAEQSKKKTDHGKIAEWREQQQALRRQMEDMVEYMKNNLLGTDAKNIANQLGDAIIGAFEGGKDAAKSWGDTVKGIVNGVVKNLLVQKVLQEPVGQLISKYTSKWVGKDGGFKGFELVANDMGKLSQDLQDLYPSLEGAMTALKDKLQLNPMAGTDTSLTGAVKGVTEETASIVAGQLNAMRINQVEANNMLRQQLFHLSEIAHNTSYNRHLEGIHNILKTNRGGDPLRAQGLPTP